jgi:hypothetical protein
MTGIKPACRRAFKAAIAEFMPMFRLERSALVPRGDLPYDYLVGDLRLRVQYGPLSRQEGFMVELGWLRTADGYWSTSCLEEPLPPGNGIRIQDACPRGREMMKQWSIQSHDDPLRSVFSSPDRAILDAIEICVVYGTDLLTRVVEREAPNALAAWVVTVADMRAYASARGLDGAAYRQVS